MIIVIRSFIPKHIISVRVDHKRARAAPEVKGDEINHCQLRSRDEERGGLVESW